MPEALHGCPHLAEDLPPATAEVHPHCQAGGDDLAHDLAGELGHHSRFLGFEDHHVVEPVPVRFDVVDLSIVFGGENGRAIV